MHYLKDNYLVSILILVYSEYANPQIWQEHLEKQFQKLGKDYVSVKKN